MQFFGYLFEIKFVEMCLRGSKRDMDIIRLWMYNICMFWQKVKEFFPYILFGLYVLEFIYLAFSPFDRTDWWAENIPVLIVVFVLVLTFKKFRFSNLSYFLIALFLMYHTIGGHFTFEKVPFYYGNQLLSYLHLDLLFNPGRNNFDRLGHFLVGVFTFPIAEFVFRKKIVKNIFWASLFGFLAIVSWAAIYEIIEMLYALSMGSQAGAAFLGSQGDIWDAQKDMLLDLCGAILFGIIFIFSRRSWSLF